MCYGVEAALGWFLLPAAISMHVLWFCQLFLPLLSMLCYHQLHEPGVALLLSGLGMLAGVGLAVLAPTLEALVLDAVVTLHAAYATTLLLYTVAATRWAALDEKRTMTATGAL